MFDIMKELKEADVLRIKALAKVLPEESVGMKMPDDIPDEAKFKFKISSESVDRDGDIVKADGIDFKWYKKNPIVLLNHWYSVENIIGKCTKIWQEGTDTYAEGYFSQTNPKAKLVQDLYNEKMVNVVSIGFMVKERDANDRNVFTKTELLEFSICAVQSNRDAERSDKQKDLIKKGIEAGLLEDDKPSTKKEVAKKEEGVTMQEQITELTKAFDTLKGDILKELGGVVELVKGIADDKANEEKKALENAKKLKTDVQKLAKGVSAYLENAKKL